MKKKHNYEYRKNKNTMRAFTGLAVYCYLMVSTTTIYLIFGGERYDFNVKHLIVYPKAYNKCVEAAWISAPTLMINFQLLPFLVMALIIIYIKPSDDILQGVSKLDELIKISYF